jgi:hypothetical protein
LYTDSDEMLFNVARPVILTSVEDIVTRGDLLDRSIIINLSAIPDTARRTEGELWAAFNAARPRILGALLDALSCALRNVAAVKLTKMPRMADFAIWGTAAETAFGLPPGGFMAAYSGNREDANALALEADVVATKLLIFMQNVDGEQWQGTATDLLQELNLLMGDQERKMDAWPKRSDKLSNRLRRLAPNLRSVGIDVQFSKSGKRQVALRKVAPGSVPSVSSVPAMPETSRNERATVPTLDATPVATFATEDAIVGTLDARDATWRNFSNGNGRHEELCECGTALVAEGLCPFCDGDRLQDGL